ncbi:uncharacterized protein LOC110989143 isoform X2 [Acanthaster planci]|nr:uncharacterized protein LOC110989143 isoform X2 [Acanthaster planci]XP_022109008.1 uncharacterized protein LOC110989143 isoform X2 [Acanthaster planci]
MNPVVVAVTVGLSLVCLTGQFGTEASAAAIIVTPPGVCVSPGEYFQLKWTAKRAHPTDSLQVHCERQNGERITIDGPSSNFTTASTRCCDAETACVLETTLTGVASGDSGFYWCVASTDGEATLHSASNVPKAYIWVSNVTVFSLSEHNKLITPGLSESITFELKCDFSGFFEVWADLENGESRQLEHIWEWEDRSSDGAPFIQGKAGQRPVLVFPSPRCRDQGLYRITYRASRFYKPVKTVRYLRITVNDTCSELDKKIKTSPTTSSKITTNDAVSKNERYSPANDSATRCDASQRDNSETKGYIFGLGIAALLLVLLLLACGYLFYQNRRLKAVGMGQSDTNDETVMEPLNVQ